MAGAARRAYSFVTRSVARVFHRHLFAVNTFSCTAIMCLGDVALQRAEQYQGLSDGFDWTRTARIAAVGSVLGSIQHLFYQSLDKRYPTRDLRTVALKVAIDQIVFSPVNIAIFIYGLGVLESKALTDINQEFIDKFTMIFLVDCAVFIPSQYINFKFLDPKYRLLFTNSVSFMYDSFLSYIKYTNLADEESARFPKACRALSKDIYVEDFLGGASSISEALKLRDDLIAILRTAGLELCKWSSTESSLLSGVDAITSSVNDISKNVEMVTKILGVY